MPVIEAEDIVKQYAEVRALDRIRFSVEEGEVFALVGPNGAGKTTLMRILTDILRPDSGTLRLFGQTKVSDALPQIGYMPEERGLYRHLCPLEVVAYFAQLKGLGRRAARQAAESALEAVQMSAHARRKMSELSKGMAQRVQFAATLAHAPRLLLLDEPFSGLDPVSARDLQRVLQDQRRAGRAILLSTHNMALAEALCDRLLMLHRGQQRLYGSIEEIKTRFADDSLQVEYAGTLPQIACARMEPVNATTARFYPQDGACRRAILRALVESGADILRFEPVVPTLEDIFIRVVGAEGEQALRQTETEERLTAL